jgi:hypothetical protein
MDTTTTNWVVLAVVLIVMLAVAAALIYSQRRKHSLRLKERFGPEYESTVKRLGSQTKAEAELAAREKRVEAFHITTLPPAEAARFTQAWNTLQSRFVDNPKGAVVQADHLVYELMLKRGYPMGDFERRAADISVHHPAVVSNYRAARVIALKDERGETTTEELRKAVVHYRALFDELLEVSEPKISPAKQSAEQVSAHS